MKLKQWQNIFFVVIANANSKVQIVIQIKNGIIKHANVNVIIIHAKLLYMQKGLQLESLYMYL